MVYFAFLRGSPPAIDVIYEPSLYPRAELPISKGWWRYVRAIY